jgi:hypothetical protein
MSDVLETLPPLYREVLEALSLPDPAPRHSVDSAVDAVQRRLRSRSRDEIRLALERLNALGLTSVPYIPGMVSPAATAQPSKWITEEGWEALGMVSLGGRSTTN